MEVDDPKEPLAVEEEKDVEQQEVGENPTPPEEKDAAAPVVDTTGEAATEPHQTSMNSPAWGTIREGDDTSSTIVVDLDKMKDSVYFLFPDRNQRLSSFWILLLSAAIIATSGVVGDSAATVIGAMIVAPLMIPILGTMLSMVLGDHDNFAFSLTLVCTGVASCWLIGYLYGFIVDPDIIDPDNNSQMAARTLPRLSDLIGALATGVVGSIALVRKDISGALPGVAISISLVPPICVSGLAGHVDWRDSARAMILFLTNFISIQVTGVLVMYIYRVHKMSSNPAAKRIIRIFIVCIIMLTLVAVPLVYTSLRLQTEAENKRCIEDAVNEHTEGTGWQTRIIVVGYEGDTLLANVVVGGEPPFPTADELRDNAVKGVCPGVDVLNIQFLPLRSIPLK